MNQAMLSSLKGVNGVMSQLNADMNPQELTKIMKEFAKESAKMEMQSEMMTDQMDMMADPEQEGEAEGVYNQILGEIGMSLNGEMKTGSGEIAASAQVADPVQDDL